MLNALRFRPGMFVLAALFLGCAAAPNTQDEDIDELEAGGEEAPIIGGSKATGYPEATLIDMGYGSNIQSACSGALITPKVVLTAGHCIGNFTDFYVTLPFANGQKAKGKGQVYDYTSNGNYVEPNQHDLGLIVLSTPLSIANYPLVANKPVPDGTKIQNIGRIDNGQFSNTALFISQPIAVKDAKNSGFPFDYITSEVIQPGDSGGPVVVAGTHNIVAVNSGAGGGTQVLAKTDLIASWIKQVVDANGGGGKFGDPLGQNPDNPPTDPVDPPTDPTGDKEVEPNNAYNQNNKLGSKMGGSLSGSDQDWFTWEVGASGVKYNLTLQATGNAQIQMWKLVNGTYYKTPQQSPTQISQTSTGAGKYFLVVYSSSGASQTYTVNLQK
ncbi:MAG: S1 family peptidase [Polyangiaceae bacterium]|nr:S1 family peptidase [Polyangiaceae bacterium]